MGLTPHDRETMIVESHPTTENAMNSIYEYEYEVELINLDDEDITGGLAALLGLGLDDLSKAKDPRNDGVFTLFIDADIHPDVAATYHSPPEHGHAQITSIQVRINGKLVELPDILSLDWMEVIAEDVFVSDRDNPYC